MFESPPPALPPLRTRFAPSPTGALHLGHAYAAGIAHDYGSPMLLRYEDIDHTRTRESYYADIERDLEWLGIGWEGTPLRQSDRLQAYSDALQTLRGKGAVYPCFCTRRQIADELDRLGHAPQEGSDGVAHYPGICKRLTDRAIRERIDRGEPHSWRWDSQYRPNNSPLPAFTDLRQGEIPADAGKLGDVIIARRDIGTSYHLAVVVDDTFQNIDLVTRGEDLLDATHVHVALQIALGLPTPQYYHHRLIRDPSGKRLATRDDAMSLDSLRARGLSPSDLVGLIHAQLP